MIHLKNNKDRWLRQRCEKCLYTGLCSGLQLFGALKPLYKEAWKSEIKESSDKKPYVIPPVTKLITLPTTRYTGEAALGNQARTYQAQIRPEEPHSWSTELWVW